jgi:hypothetical protein
MYLVSMVGITSVMVMAFILMVTVGGTEVDTHCISCPQM